MTVMSPTASSVCVIVAVLILYLPESSACGRGAIYLQGNEYQQTLVAISEGVPEDLRLIDRIKEVFTQASYTLWKATRYRARFGEIRILLPKTWSYNVTYEPVANETFDTSDIVVDAPDPTSGNGNRPFVIKSTPCGELGYYMHLTPDFLLDETLAAQYGPYDKVLVHEWAHLRYGVYDEYTTEAEGDHFYVSSGGIVEATRCSNDIQGSWVDSQSGKVCPWSSGPPPTTCRFKPDSIRGSKYASLMYGQYLEQVTEFCDDDATNRATLHNREAPNQQNRLCGGRSVWEVMRSHADFANDANPSVDIEEYQDPTFRVIRADIKRTVLVLDTSGSMGNEDRMKKQNQGCTNFIATVVEDGEKIGIVSFAATAKTEKEMTVISNVTRSELINALPPTPNGGTSIGSGVLQGLEVLTNDGGTAGATLLIVSDGDENTDPRIADVLDELMSSGVTVHTIAFTDAADNKLDSLAHNTGGLAFLYSGKDTSNALNEAFETIGSLNNNPRTHSYTILSEATTMSAGQVVQGEGIVDSTLGRETEFLFDYGNAVGIQLVLESPSGVKYTEGSSECFVDTNALVTRCLLPGLSEVGTWRYNVTNKGAAQRLAVTIKSKSADDNDYPIIAQAFWGLDELDLNSPNPPVQTLFASVSKGYVAVLNAIVEAEVETPTTTVPVTLKDNGAGADLTKDDGVYSAYFTQVTSQGRHNVKVTVDSNAATMINPQYIVGRGAAYPRHRNQRDVVTPTGDFRRSATGGVFQLTKLPAEPTDKLYDPGQIHDLTLGGIEGNNVNLLWTAPGAELDVGTVSYYEIWLSRSYNFTSGDYAVLNQDNVTYGDLRGPQAPQHRENITLELAHPDGDAYYFAVVAYDNSRTPPASSLLSNIVVTSLADPMPANPVEEDDHTVVYITVEEDDHTVVYITVEEDDHTVVYITVEEDDHTVVYITVEEDDHTVVYIIVGVVAAVLLILLILLIVCCCIRKRNSKKVQDSVFTSTMVVYSRGDTEIYANTGAHLAKQGNRNSNYIEE